jgi:L-cystine uptake protein TcyP (sodium:dicarboxylate symporter family)
MGCVWLNHTLILMGQYWRLFFGRLLIKIAIYKFNGNILTNNLVNWFLIGGNRFYRFIKVVACPLKM